MKTDFPLHRSKHTYSREQIMLPFETFNTMLVVFNIALFIYLPAAIFLAVSREEDLDIQLDALVLLTIRRWVLRQLEGHA